MCGVGIVLGIGHLRLDLEVRCSAVYAQTILIRWGPAKNTFETPAPFSPCSSLGGPCLASMVEMNALRETLTPAPSPRKKAPLS
jgi:hypothetical protein